MELDANLVSSSVYVLLSLFCSSLANLSLLVMSCYNTVTGELDRDDSGQFAPLYENMPTSTKPEVRNLLHCLQRRTEPWPQVT